MGDLLQVATENAYSLADCAERHKATLEWVELIDAEIR